MIQTSAAPSAPPSAGPSWLALVDEVAVAGVVLAALVAGSLPTLVVAAFIGARVG
ncbi:hypothetical protein LWF15_19110 [Kineosporia rhizophila]|uniref:hypothetical protein n=1 Tax=Kineosporia TaxID=49184 RepID=UPI001E4185A7|nr:MULTISPECIES: hypothetical protein [Kineosporia]MCE0537603.1 hypothetical protein [Kineosporia rhizophila]GLY18883.1 hypothetical protein Kisp01_58970 [Kineosporia sp. NBRC 101677]